MDTDTPLRFRRAELSLSQKQAAQKVGIGQSHWSRLERGHQMPSAWLLIQISNEFQLTADEILRPFESHA